MRSRATNPAQWTETGRSRAISVTRACAAAFTAGETLPATINSTGLPGAAASELANAELARELALALIYSNNPNYFQYQMALANASAIKNTDKLIFTTEGTFPSLVFGQNLQPVVPVVGTTPTPQ